MTTLERSFPRRLDALEALFAFAAAGLQSLGLAASLQPTVDFVLEELFTNMVKYSSSRHDVRVQMRRDGDSVEVTLDDEGSAFFDVTAPPPVDTGATLDQRQPGGLGLHLIGKLVDSIEYRYDPEQRHARIVFRKSAA